MLWLGLSLPISLGIVSLSAFLGPWPTLITGGVCAFILAVGFVANLHFF